MRAFWHFQTMPVVGGTPTWMIGVVHLVLFCAVALVLALAARALWRRRGEWRELAVGSSSETAFTQSAALWGFGVLLTLAMVGVERHYLIVAFPLNLLWFARLALVHPVAGRRLLLLCGAAQLIIALGFLSYVHTYGGAEDGDYGVSFSRQTTPPDTR
jgi:hypothetical protein